VQVPRGANGEPVHPLEISPSFALDPEELERRVARDLRIAGPTLLK
jgi:hypothetical protein